jgi:hypothetical protein
MSVFLQYDIKRKAAPTNEGGFSRRNPNTKAREKIARNKRGW